ncbi:unnamed protein product [Effrenium voratum]|nr:unnamed protein product [Effrenium voratum]CAJ1455189.1 unnamed protein product [Effrenium voratum]
MRPFGLNLKLADSACRFATLSLHRPPVASLSIGPISQKLTHNSPPVADSSEYVVWSSPRRQCLPDANRGFSENLEARRSSLGADSADSDSGSQTEMADVAPLSGTMHGRGLRSLS